MESILIYATLSAIKENKGNVGSVLDIFQDLVETAIKQHFGTVGKKGYVNELKTTIFNEYHLDIPFPTLELILSKINKNYSGMFHVYGDHSFDFSDITFSDVSQLIDIQKEKTDKLNIIFLNEKKKRGIKSPLSLNEIIEKNKKNLLAYFNRRPFDTIIEDEDFDLLVSFLRVPEHKVLIENLFLGALISCFTLLDPERLDDKKIMLLDTNFIISLMDLNSIEYYETCKQILKIGIKAGYDFCILPETIVEIKNLLQRKSYEINDVPMFASQDRQSIEFGCYRKNLTGQDLIEHSKFIESFLRDNKIRIIDMTTNERLKKNAPGSEIYKTIGNRKINKIGALHDAMAMNFVKENRTDEEDSFSNTSSFFVTDSHGYYENKISLSTKLPLIIRAEELITLLWLVFPYHDTNLMKSEISKIFSMYLSKKLPNRDLLSAIDNKNRAYKHIGIHSKDCVKLAFDINEINTSEIEKLLSIKDEDEYYKEIGRLATLAAERKEKHEDKMRELTESIIDSTWEENNKTILDENQALRKEAVAMEKENERLKVLKDSRELDVKIEFQKELISQLSERIKDHMEPIIAMNKLLPILLIIISLIIVIYFCIRHIIPSWDKTEPLIFAVQLCIPFIVTILEIIGISKKLSLIRFSSVICNLFYRTRKDKIKRLNEELKEKNSYLVSLIEKRDNIIY
ncbi:hypothetical protein AGMMS49940_18870 [Spirochaetia bacterium]|nr:hypothetical protein AGMMS49940_18870 [Spirochaetia bacterium]